MSDTRPGGRWLVWECRAGALKWRTITHVDSEQNGEPFLPDVRVKRVGGYSTLAAAVAAMRSEAGSGR